MHQVLIESGINYVEHHRPRIHHHHHQVDFTVPAKFGLTCRSKDNTNSRMGRSLQIFFTAIRGRRA